MARTDLIHGDRRADRRYDYEMDLRFSYSVDGVTQFGSGHTLDLSRGAIRFAADDPPPQGVDIELRIAWPFLLQNICPLELVVHGAVLGTSERGTVLAMKDYQFRTCGQRSFDQVVAGAAGSSIIA